MKLSEAIMLLVAFVIILGALAGDFHIFSNLFRGCS